MTSRSSFASLLTACLLAAGFLVIAPVANAASAGQYVMKPGTRNNVNRVKPRGVRIHLPVGPASVYCEYPYYYSRGHYPTHIGGYVYYPHYYQNTCWGYNRGPALLRQRGAWN